MGVMNVTPDSFSDGGEVLTAEEFQGRLQTLGPLDILDVGAESTAPMNRPVSWRTEWERLEIFLPELLKLQCPLSLDTYHPETIFEFLRHWHGPLIWNDVSGQFDEHVERFLLDDPSHTYVLCHNRVPSREATGRHMEYVGASRGHLLEELEEFFRPHRRPQVVFDPCLGFSKSYDENWEILEHFHELQARLPHDRWLLGFSRKSFLRKRFDLGIEDRAGLDGTHARVFDEMKSRLCGEVWLRTHRPDLL
jgi:dihydropteroate synthase